ncbi:CoA-transferase [Falsiroseomonas sp. CW058]|uniref:CoA-transferase n=1 Tax=Falsiroseomonas sp. CW058 TaxID=3388664 RepID=UPI003D31E882
MTDAALLISLIADLIGDAEHVATGALSPIPTAAAMLARRRSGGRMRVTILGSRRNSRFTDGAKELFDCAAQGRIDVFFLSGAQIDGEANINLLGIGDHRRPKVRFAGSFGSPYLYMLVPRVILFRLGHDRRALVPKVDFVSAPGWSPPHVHRPGGPQALVTGRCVFDWQRAARRFALRSLHPGETAEGVREATGFDYDAPAAPPVSPVPDAALREEIRDLVLDEVAEAYPRFAEEFRI